jgi:hypothetical protein
VRNLHLEEVQSVVDEVDHVHFPRHGQCVVQEWSQSVMLGRFDHVFVVMHNGLELLFDSVGDLCGEPDV